MIEKKKKIQKTSKLLILYKKKKKKKNTKDLLATYFDYSFKNGLKLAVIFSQ